MQNTKLPQSLLPKHIIKPSKERFEESFRESLSTRNSFGQSTGDSLLIEDTAIYIYPDALDVLRTMIPVRNRHSEQVLVIEHTKIGYKITYIQDITGSQEKIKTHSKAIQSIDEIQDKELDFIAVFWPGTGNILKKHHFKDKLKHACGVGHSQVLSKAVTRVIDNTASEIDIGLLKS